jgi:hypothetical protein
VSDDVRPVVAYPETAVLDKQQLAAALGISERQIDRLDLPCVYLGTQTPRWVWGQVLALLKENAS